MSRQRTYIDFIKGIFEHLLKVEKFTEGLSYDEFIQDEKMIYACVG